MLLTCKSNPVTPDRNGSVKRPERKLWSNHRHSQCSCIIVLSCANNSPDSNRDGTKMEQREMKKMSSEGSRLSPLAMHTRWLQNNGLWIEANPEQEVITDHNCAGTSLDVSSDILLALQRALLSGALQACSTPLQNLITRTQKLNKLKNCQVRSFTSLQTVHTHMHEQKKDHKEPDCMRYTDNTDTPPHHVACEQLCEHISSKPNSRTCSIA